MAAGDSGWGDLPAGPAAIVSAVTREGTALDDFLAGLSAADLERPSACTEWTVAEVVAHLALGGRRYLKRLDAALAEPPVPAAAPRGPAITAADIAPAAKTARQRMGSTVREALHEANTQLIARFSALSPDDLQRSSGSPVGPIYRVAQMRAFELALHSWDIRSAFTPAPGLAGPSLPVLVDYLGSWFRLTFRPDTAQARPFRLLLEWVAQGWPAYELRVEADSHFYGPAAEGAVDRVLPCEAGGLILFATGRTGPPPEFNDGFDLTRLFRARFPAM